MKTARSRMTSMTTLRRTLSFTLYFTFTALALLVSFAESLTPGPLGKHCVFTYQNRFYVLGGTNGRAPSGELYYIEAPFQASDPRWIHQRLSNPRAVVGAACSVTSSGILLVTGGAYASEDAPGVLSLNLTSQTPQWIEPNLRSDISNALISRTNHKQLIYKTSQGDEILFVYGGDKHDPNLVLHIGNMTWEVVENGENTPLVDSQFAMFASKDNVYIVGGINSGNDVEDAKIFGYNLIQKVWFDPGTQLPSTLLNGHVAQLNSIVYFVYDERSSKSTRSLAWHLPTGSWTILENVGGTNATTYDLYESAQMAGCDALIMYGGYSNITNKFVSELSVFNMTQRRMTDNAALVTDAVEDHYFGGPLAPQQIDPFNSTPSGKSRISHQRSSKLSVAAGFLILFFILGTIILVTIMMVKKKRRVRKIPTPTPRFVEKGDNNDHFFQKSRNSAETDYSIFDAKNLHKSSHSDGESSLPSYPLPEKKSESIYENGDNVVSSAYPSSVNIDNQLRMNSMGLYHSFNNDTERNSAASTGSISLAPPAYESVTGSIDLQEKGVASTAPDSAASHVNSAASNVNSAASNVNLAASNVIADKLSQATFGNDKIKRITYEGSVDITITPSAPTGTMLFGRYELTGTSAVVGKNAVRRAMDWTVNQTVAIKYFNCRKSYEREVFMLNNLRSRHVAELQSVYEVASSSEYPFITIMTYYPQTLQEIIQNQLAEMDDLYLRLVIKSIANALQFLHSQGIAHLDLKPGNIARDFGDITSWRLIDFETARFVGEEGVDHCTPSYSSPEVLFAALTKSPVKTATSMDIWSFGSIIFEMYSLVPLFSEAYTAMERLTEAHRLSYFKFPVDYVHDVEAQNVLHKTLVFEPGKRATISDILCEPFLNNSNAEARLRRDIVRQRRDAPIDWQQITKSSSSSGQTSPTIADQTQPNSEDNTQITLSQVNAVMFSIMDAQRADVPRLCAVLPGDDSMSIANPATWNGNTFLLHLLCEGLDSGCRDAHFTEFKGYQIPNPKSFLRKAGPYLTIVAAVAALKTHMPPSVLECILLFAASPTDCFSQIAHAIDQVLAPDARDSGCTRRDPVAHARAAQKTAQRTIMEFLLLHDPKNELSGLRRVIMPGGLPRWLCSTCAVQIRDSTLASDPGYQQTWASYTKI